MKYSIKDSTLNELAHQLRLSMEHYTDMPTYHFVEINLSDDEQIYTMEMPEDYAPECNLMRVRVEIPVDRESCFPVGYCSGYYETVEEAKQAPDYTVINWEDSDDEAGIMIRYALASSRAITFVVDGDTNGNSMCIFVEAFTVPDEEPGFSMEGIVSNIGGLMPFIELEEIEITENGIYGDDAELANPVYHRVIVNVPAEEPVLEEIEITENGEYSPDDGVDGFSTVIVNVPAGGGGVDIPEEALTITGACNYRFGNNGWNWFIEQVGHKITTKNITAITYMFSNSTELEEISFDINCTTSQSVIFNNAFNNCHKLKNIPMINNLKISSSSESNLFSNCYSIRNFPEGFGDNWDFTEVNKNSYSGLPYLFTNCYSLRQVPESIISKFWSKSTSSYSTSYRETFSYCASLDEIHNLAVQQANLTSNILGSTFSYTMRLKDMTFTTNEDGTPKTATWKNQTVDLSTYCGYATSITAAQILNYNSGITADKNVSDDATYQALKNDPDWWTANINYSRYNHDSAVNTINSLPDCSATGTNTIKFKGAAGSLTDGGAINTLTEEEIAVAASKGWTVTLS